MKNHSNYLSEILGRSDFIGKSIHEVILNKSNLSTDQKSTVDSTIDFSLGEDIMNYELNEHGLVRNIEYNRKDEKRIIELDWAPIANEDGNVEKILVTLKDVTELRILEIEAQEQKKIMDIIAEVIDLQADRFISFVKVSSNFLSENKRLIEAAHEKDLEVLKILFINMHTMKGAARTYHLKGLTSVMHDAEQEYAAIQKGQSAWNRTKLLQDLKEVEDIFYFYSYVWEEKLGRDTNGDHIEINLETLKLDICNPGN